LLPLLVLLHRLAFFEVGMIIHTVLLVMVTNLVEGSSDGVEDANSGSVEMM